MQSAPLPPRIIEKGLASDRVVIGKLDHRVAAIISVVETCRRFKVDRPRAIRVPTCAS